MTYFTIGKLSQAVGVRPDTIRYYERNGLLPLPDLLPDTPATAKPPWSV